LRTRECEKFQLSEKFRPVEVPANATLDSTFYLGAKVVPNNNLEMNSYSGHTPEGIATRPTINLVVTVCVPLSGYYRGAWTVKDCFPYIHSYLSVFPEPSYFRKTYVKDFLLLKCYNSKLFCRMLDINIGIADPNVFEPPSECE